MTEDPIDLGPPLVIGAIMLAVGIALPVIAFCWCSKWAIKWAVQKVKKATANRGKGGES